MFHPSAAAALSEATPAACAALVAQGVTAAVLVENAEGRWFLLHADSVRHADVLAAHWADPRYMGARQCSVWSIAGGEIAEAAAWAA
jgi:hypothetical protein